MYFSQGARQKHKQPEPVPTTPWRPGVTQCSNISRDMLEYTHIPGVHNLGKGVVNDLLIVSLV